MKKVKNLLARSCLESESGKVLDDLLRRLLMVRYISLELEEMHLSVKNLILDSVMSLPTSSFCSLKRSSSTSERLFFHLRSSLRRSRLALWITSLYHGSLCLTAVVLVIKGHTS